MATSSPRRATSRLVSRSGSANRAVPSSPVTATCRPASASICTPGRGAPSFSAVAQATISLWSANASRPIWVTWTQACTTRRYRSWLSSCSSAGSTTTTSCPRSPSSAGLRSMLTSVRASGALSSIDGLVHHPPAGGLWWVVLAVELSYIVPEGGPVGRFNPVGAHSKAVVIDGEYREDRFFRGRVQGDQRLLRSKQGRLGGAYVEGQLCGRPQRLAKGVLDGPIDLDPVGGAPGGHPTNGDRVADNVHRRSGELWLDAQHGLVVGVDVNGVVELDEQREPAADTRRRTRRSCAARRAAVHRCGTRSAGPRW